MKTGEKMIVAIIRNIGCVLQFNFPSHSFLPRGDEMNQLIIIIIIILILLSSSNFLFHFLLNYNFSAYKTGGLFNIRWLYYT